MLAVNIPTELWGGGVVLLLVFLFNASHVFRYYAKFAIFGVLCTIASLVFVPLMLLRPLDYRNALGPAWGARQISKILGIKWEVKGIENIIKDSGCVVVINHQSALDLLILAELWPILGRCTVVVKREVFYYFPFGHICWLWGTLFIDRLNYEKAQSAINKTGETVRSKKAKLFIFPEGTRNTKPYILPFKKGAFHVAIASQTAVQPVVASYFYFLDSKRRIFDSGKSVINIMPAISTQGLIRENLDVLMKKTHDIMSINFKTLTDHVLLTENKKITNYT